MVYKDAGHFIDALSTGCNHATVAGDDSVFAIYYYRVDKPEQSRLGGSFLFRVNTLFE